MLTPARERLSSTIVLPPASVRRAFALLALLALALMFVACGKKNNGGGAAINAAPTVSAGPDVAGAVGQAVTLNGAVTDDGLPAARAVTSTWSKVSGPGNVVFANANAAATTATFDAVGSYVVRLTATDGSLSAADNATVTITAPVQNQAPTANAGTDTAGTAGNAVALNGSAADDGLPAGSSVTVTWAKVSGPGNVAFANANAAVTTATFDAAGAYVVSLTATDGPLSATDEAAVTITAPVQNQAPTVSAGPDVTGVTGTAVALNGTVADDGLPAGRAVTATWSKVSGPGQVVFANANAAATTATFDAAGSYVVRLTASDGALSASDEATATITAPVAAGPVVRSVNPANYTAGQPVTVTLTCTLPGGTASYGLEETPPAGWTIAAISDGGTLTAGVIRWIFLDGNNRTITYTATPPAGTTGQQAFAGIANIDGGANQTISGVASISP